ncbi:MAG: DivIVA domain-containing protein [Myxococcota bacterium]|nr:DivIVA domain-containing protein [Myxococcota bacterium]
MRIAPVEIKQHRFSRRVRGFDPDEVEAFLDAVVADFEEVVRENAQLRREAERSSREIETYRARERTIQDTLTTAQEVVEGLKRTAIRESEVIVGQAEGRADKLLEEAELRRADLTAEVAELRQLRKRVENDLRRTLEGYLGMIDAFQEARTSQPQNQSQIQSRAPRPNRPNRPNRSDRKR